MNWYGRDSANDVIVPKDQSHWSRFPLQERWKQWGKNVTTDDADFSCESMMDEVQLDQLVCRPEQAEISCGQVQDGVSEESSLYWTTLLNNQDYQPNEVSGTNQTVENFMNSLLVDDVNGSDHFHFYGSPRSHGSFSMGNNVTSDMVLDSSTDLYSMHDMLSYEHLNEEDFQYSLDCENQQYDTHFSLSDTMTNAIPLCNTRVGDQPSFEEAVLQEFGSAMQKMTAESRLCFRDALYRLAINSEKHSSNQGQDGNNLQSKNPFTTVLPDQTMRSTESEACELRTNTIDRTVAELMFNKAQMNDNSHQELVSTAKPCSKNSLNNSLAPHFQHFTEPTPEDAVVPTLGQGEPQYSEY